MFAAMFFMIFVLFILKSIFQKRIINEKKYLFIIEVIGLLILTFCLLTWTIIETMWIGFFLLIFSSSLSEALISNLLAKIVPVYFKILCIHSETIISSISAITKILSGLIIFLFCFKTEDGRN